MRDQTPSQTAAWVAATRGLGSLLPDDVRLVDDPYGIAFAPPRWRSLTTLAEQSNTARALVTKPGFGSWVLYMQVRTRVLDDIVRRFVGECGARCQVILLGAGFDCRALRLIELANAEVFEVDHPATQKRKRDTLEQLGAQSRARYVTWDFESRPMSELPDTLARAGHDRSKPTLTIWEGVTMYLTEPAIEASVSAIAAYSAPRSRLAMTYFSRDRIEANTVISRAAHALVARYGEPWRWGWNPSELPVWLRDRGFTVERDFSMAEAAHQLLPAKAARLVGDPDRRVALLSRGESISVSYRTGTGS